MQPSRILPDLQCSLLCEDVRQEANGKFLLIGVLNFIPVPQVPITAHRLLFYNRWTAGVGEFLQTIRLIAPDQVTELSKSETKFALGELRLGLAQFGHLVRGDEADGLQEFPHAGRPPIVEQQAVRGNRDLRNGDKIQDADEQKLPVRLLPNVFAQEGALEVGQDS